MYFDNLKLFIPRNTIKDTGTVYVQASENDFSFEDR